MREITDKEQQIKALENKVNKATVTTEQLRNSSIDILKDELDDKKKGNKRKDFIIILLVLLQFLSFVYYNYSFKDFIGQYDFETTYEQSFDNNNSGSNVSDINEVNK